MLRQFLIVLFLIAPLTAPAQKKKGLNKQLDIFWKSKKLRSSAVALAALFKAGDTIADIGTANGWFAAALSMYGGDSLTFYLEDIDSSIWNQPRFDSAVQHFSRINQKQVSHQFHHVTGTEKNTGLPPKVFDKVLIIDTYHHFTHRDDMLSDIVNLLNHDGKIVILEALARKPGDIHQGCRTPIYLEHEIISHLQSHNMKLESVRFIHKVAGRKNKLFVFVKN